MEASSGTGRRFGQAVSTPVGLMAVALALMWAIEAVDRWILDDYLQGWGIRPQSADGLTGVITAPLLHVDWGHLASNTVPLAVMGGLVAARGMRYWARVTVLIIVGGGLATWLVAGGTNHIGASGIVFGYFGVLLGAAWFERRPAALGGALLAIFLYGTMVTGLVPQPELSWEGHLFGFLFGVAGARIWAEPREYRDPDDPGDVQPWELDEPWLD